MHSERSPASLFEDGEISCGLRRDDHSKGVFLARNREILRVVGGDLQENASIRATFIVLSGGVEEAWAETETGGHLL